jgi:glyoxylase-like metal-dependent hydrolase (beta-lactamase superfamily II)
MPGSKSIVSIFDNLKMIRPPSSCWPESANVYVFKEGDGISFFDVGCGSVTSVDRLFSALKNLKWESKPVKKIILSHAHPDHMGAMEIVLSEVSAEHIILHEIDAPYALDPERLTLSFDIPLCKEWLAETGDQGNEGKKGSEFDLIAYFRALGCSMCNAKPNRTVVEGDTIRVGDYHFQVFHTPGHAPGHISLYEPGKRLLPAGDILGEMVAWYAPSSGGAEGYLESLQKIGNLDIDLILPSHGSVIVDARKSIQETREKILQKDQVIVKALQTGPKTFRELNRLLFNSPSIQFFPGTPILESHLQKLKKEGKIRRYRRGSNRFCVV